MRKSDKRGKKRGEINNARKSVNLRRFHLTARILDLSYSLPLEISHEKPPQQIGLETFMICSLILYHLILFHKICKKTTSNIRTLHKEIRSNILYFVILKPELKI